MNGLKEVSRLIEESENTRMKLSISQVMLIVPFPTKEKKSFWKTIFNNLVFITLFKIFVYQDAVMDWMSNNKVLSVVLEGNIDQVQYTDRIKAIVEFLGPKLSPDELTNIWNLGEVKNINLRPLLSFYLLIN